MTVLKLLDDNRTITNVNEISEYLENTGILFERWETDIDFDDNADQETILNAYSNNLKPFMEKHGFQSADVINVHRETPNIETIREKFLSEHTHSEDEIRFFVDGNGEFFFHLEEPKEIVFSLCLQKGDFISVPKNTKHWFDLAPQYFVKAIRIFSNQEGWVPHYTNSGLEKKYLK